MLESHWDRAVEGHGPGTMLGADPEEGCELVPHVQYRPGIMVSPVTAILVNGPTLFKFRSNCVGPSIVTPESAEAPLLW